MKNEKPKNQKKTKPAAARARSRSNAKKAKTDADLIAEIYADIFSGITDADGKAKTFTEKEKQFIVAYLTDAKFCAADAARACYDAKTDNSFRVIGSQILKKPHIRQAINNALETLVMPKFEVLFRLSEIAAGDIADLTDDDGNFDFEIAKSNGKTGLIYQLETDRQILEVSSETVDAPGADGDGEKEVLEKSITSEKRKIKIYNKLNALELIARYYKLLSDKIELSGADGEPLSKVCIYLPDNGRGDSPGANRGKKK